MRLPIEQDPQLTLRAILLGVVLAMIMAAANAYLGLFAGTTIASAIPAAVVSMAVLKAVGGHILENNIVATGASAGSSIATGVIFTIPALVILGYWEDFRYSWVLAIAGLGGILGVLFSVPLRRSLIVEQQLAFPEGKAAAEVLRSGDRPGRGLGTLAAAGLVGGALKLAAANGLRLIPDNFSAAAWFDRSIVYFGINFSPALLGVGYIVGLNVSTVMLAGGIIAWSIAIPVYASYFLVGDSALSSIVAGVSAGDAANAIWSVQVRYIGVGAMLVGGVWTLFTLRNSLLSGIRSGLSAEKAGVSEVQDSSARDIPMRLILIGIVAFVLPLVFLYQAVVQQWLVSLPMTVVMIITGFLFVSVSAYMAGLVGSSNNPVSGITIATILFAAAVLYVLLEAHSAIGPAATIMIGAVVCCAACIGGDNLQDLKCGHILGATPWKQQIMLAVGGVSSALVMAPILNLLADAYGIGTPTGLHPTPLLAPQATLMAEVAKGFFGDGLPWAMIGVGAAIGVCIIVIDEILASRRSAIRTPVLACAVGIYLPLDLSVPIFVGGLVAFLVKRRASDYEGRRGHVRNNQHGILAAAGLITGEALMGILVAIPIVVFASDDVLALPSQFRFGGWLGLVFLAGAALFVYRQAAMDKA